MVVIINRHSHQKNLSTNDEFFFIRSNGKFNITTGLDEIDEYADGGTISNNKYFNVVFGIVHNDITPPNLMAVVQNTPGSEYNSVASAEADPSNTLNIFPSNTLLKQLFLPIGRVVMKRSSSANTIETLLNGRTFLDLRGTVTASGSSPPNTRNNKPR